MVLADFLTETRKRWLKAFKLFKRNANYKHGKSNRVSPLVHSPSYSGTVDARADIDVHTFCACRSSMPPLSATTPDSAYENASYYSTYNSSDSCRSYSVTGSSDNSVTGGYSGTGSSDNSVTGGYDCTRGSDSAYNSARSSPARSRAPVCYATVTYFNVNDSEDSSSIRTEYTILELELDADAESDENAQNIINENIEIVSSL